MPRGVYKRVPGARKSMSSLEEKKAKLMVLYNAGCTQTELAMLVGCSQANISKLLKKWGIPTTPNVNHRWLKELTPRQRSIIIGTVLGDGNLNITNDGGKNAHLQLKHSTKQSDWLRWKCNELRNLFRMQPRVYKEKGAFKGKYADRVYEKIYAVSKSHPLLTDIHKQFYFPKKQVTLDILNQVDDLALAVWFCDDGGRGVNVQNIVAGGLTEEEYDLLEIWFHDQGFGPSRVNYKNEDVVRYDMYSNIFRQRIEPYVPECMRHKLVYP